MVSIPCMRDSKRDTDIKNRLLDSLGEGKGGMVCENSIGICILPYVKQITSPSSMHETGHSKPMLWNNPSPGCSLEGMMLKLKLQYFGHLMRRVLVQMFKLELEKLEEQRSNCHHPLDHRKSTDGETELISLMPSALSFFFPPLWLFWVFVAVHGLSLVVTSWVYSSM